MQISALTISIRDAYAGIRGKLRWLSDRLAILLRDIKQDSKNTIAVLDGVRAFACLFVIIYHINRTFGENPFIWSIPSYPLSTSIVTAGATGVMLFFVLSGFLLFMPYAKALLFDAPWPSARVFYLRRALRILPGYYVALFVLILLSHPEYLHRDHLKDLLLFLTFFMDSSPHTYQQINGPFWTLGTEWQFYMLLPLLAFGLGFILRRISLQRRLPVLIGCLLGMIVYGMAVRYYGFYLQLHPTQAFPGHRSLTNIVMFFLFGVQGKYLEVFAIGMLVSACYIYAKHAPAGSNFMIRAKQLSLWLWGCGLVLLVFTTMWHFSIDHNQYRGWPQGYLGWPFLSFLAPWYDRLYPFCVAIGYGTCIAAILFGPVELKRLFEWRFLRWVGLISYSLYIWHLPLLLYLHDHILPHLHLSIRASYSLYWAWALFVIIPFATLCYIVIERPWMRLGDRWRKRLSVGAQ
jgi:peptidoglycan/LPS O-acetylase OafA/YrhL